MTGSTSNSDLRSTWESAADGWAKWEQTISAGLSDATETLIDMAGVRPPMRVLDLACGAGDQSLQAAKRVGPNGTVVAVDISARMLEHLRRNAGRAGLHNIETLECAAEELGQAQNLFDAAICRLGLMLFPAPRRALEAVQGAMRPGARFAALVFTTPAANPFLTRTMAILLRHAGKSPPAPGQPGLFALGGEGVLASLLKESGLGQVETKTMRALLGLPNASDALEMMQQAFGAYRAVVADLSEAEKSQAWADVYQRLKEFEADDGFSAEFEFIIGSGAKPS
jgi:ubiquinone/menaquinone biosynthesis C-methylase UbiE